MLPSQELIKIISEGKLKTYNHNTSFLQVYWQHPNLNQHQYYLFVFTAMQQELVDVTVVTPSWLPVRHKPKQFVPVVNRLMSDLLKELKTSQANA